MLGPPLGSRAAAWHRARSWGGLLQVGSLRPPSLPDFGLSPAGWAALSPQGLGGVGGGGSGCGSGVRPRHRSRPRAHGTAAAHPWWCNHCRAPTALQAPECTHGAAPIAVHPLHGTLVVPPVRSPPRCAAPIAVRPRRCTRCSTHRGVRTVPFPCRYPLRGCCAKGARARQGCPGGRSPQIPSSSCQHPALRCAATCAARSVPAWAAVPG